jgi:hypothetical protein
MRKHAETHLGGFGSAEAASDWSFVAACSTCMGGPAGGWMLWMVVRGFSRGGRHGTARLGGQQAITIAIKTRDSADIWSGQREAGGETRFDKTSGGGGTEVAKAKSPMQDLLDAWQGCRHRNHGYPFLGTLRLSVPRCAVPAVILLKLPEASSGRRPTVFIHRHSKPATGHDRPLAGGKQEKAWARNPSCASPANTKTLCERAERQLQPSIATVLSIVRTRASPSVRLSHATPKRFVPCPFKTRGLPLLFAAWPTALTRTLTWLSCISPS